MPMFGTPRPCELIQVLQYSLLTALNLGSAQKACLSENCGLLS